MGLHHPVSFSMLQYVAVCCSVLQYVAVCCSVLQCNIVYHLFIFIHIGLYLILLCYGVAMISRLLKNTGLFCRIWSLL